MYKCCDQEFKTFEEVVTWAWNQHKIEACCDLKEVDMLHESEKQEACEQLSKILSTIDEEGCC